MLLVLDLTLTYMNQKKWINDFLLGNASVDDVCIDITKRISGDIKGTLNVGFANSSKEEIYKLEGNVSRQSSQMQLLRNFILLREELFVKKNADFVIIDTSPGIRYWSINSLALADVLLLTLKFDDLDIDGTKKIAKDIYGSFLEFGAKSYLLLNRVAGYCVPTDGNMAKLSGFVQQDKDLYDMLSRETGMEVITTIPCYCDIQFSRKEYLTVLKSSDHPFAKQIEKLATSEQIKV